MMFQFINTTLPYVWCVHLKRTVVCFSNTFRIRSSLAKLLVVLHHTWLIKTPIIYYVVKKNQNSYQTYTHMRLAYEAKTFPNNETDVVFTGKSSKSTKNLLY